jgi:mannan endo-1,4-beta-mannosidase
MKWCLAPFCSFLRSSDVKKLVNGAGHLLIFFFIFALSSCQPEKEEETKKSSWSKHSPNAARLMNYLWDNYGTNIISGQMDISWSTNGNTYTDSEDKKHYNDMITAIYDDTGKYPAIKGFDLIQLPSEGAPFWGGKEQVDEAIEWWEGKNKVNGQNPATKLLPDSPDIHGLITFCWHWRKLPVTGGSPLGGFYASWETRGDRTSFTIPWKTLPGGGGTLDTQSAAWRTIIEDLDKVAELFKPLKEKDIPVLWRPLHEAAGNWSPSNQQGAWFWWGASGPGPYIALWEFMYEYLTIKKGLDNLIWVWNAQNAQWVPNPYTIDIVGYDRYADKGDTKSQKNYFNSTKAMVNDGSERIVALSENGVIPDPDECIKDNAMWSWFKVWNNMHDINSTEHLIHVYTHPNVITLDKLPDITKYRLK